MIVNKKDAREALHLIEEGLGDDIVKLHYYEEFKTLKEFVNSKKEPGENQILLSLELSVTFGSDDVIASYSDAFEEVRTLVNEAREIGSLEATIQYPRHTEDIEE